MRGRVRHTCLYGTASRDHAPRYNAGVSVLLPLFPLDVVLFPGTALPLHVFEPRYKEMIGELLESKGKFGVVRGAAEGVASVGCTAEIMAVTKQYEDGRMDIVAEGRERFEVMDINTERSFYRAEVLYFVDEPEPPRKEQNARLIEIHSEALALLGATAEAPPADEKELSFLVAGSMPFDLDFKQKLLVMRSEPQRVEALLKYYEGILPSLRRAVKARQKSGGNGHV
jgi:Lon protease-like protein